MTGLAGRLASEGWRPDRIFSSPLPRARQTAEIVRGAAPHAPAIEPLDELLPEWEPSELLATLEERDAAEGRVLLVSHQPLAGRLAALLTGGVMPFKPGTLVGIECEKGTGRMRGRVIRVIDPEE
jgi:phosphohistidine phosphatase